MSGDWQRVNPRRPCPVCGKPDWCLIAADGSAAICARIDDGAVKRCGDAGWLHRLEKSPRPWPRPRVRRVPVQRTDRAGQDLNVLAARYTAAVEPGALSNLADELGVTTASLERLRIGWDGAAWTFPMADAAGHVVGIRRRFPDGRKLAVKGGREGLFVPAEIDGGQLLLICEGPTDCAALLDLAFLTVGRPSCTGGTRHVVELIRQWHVGQVVIVADADAPGLRGAAALASVARVYCPDVRVIQPPDAVKDARAWKRDGATTEDVRCAIDAAPVRQLIVTTRQNKERLAWKRTTKANS